MMSTTTNIKKIKDLTKGQIFRTENGRYRVDRPYWPEARNPMYRVASIVCIERFTPHPYYGMEVNESRVSFNCNTKVELE